MCKPLLSWVWENKKKAWYELRNNCCRYSDTSDSPCENPKLETKSLYDFVPGEPFASWWILNIFLPDITLKINELDVSGITFPPDLPSDWRRTWTELKEKEWGRGGVATFRFKWYFQRDPHFPQRRLIPAQCPSPAVFAAVILLWKPGVASISRSTRHECLCTSHI